jgi:hypothetical protein
MTAEEINVLNSNLHAALSIADGPQPLTDAIEIGAALSELPADDWDLLDFPLRDARSDLQLYTDQNKNCMRWLKLTYDTVRSEIRMKYEVV